MKSKPQTVDAYLASLPEDRRKALEAVRRVIRKNLGKGYEEGIQYNMIGYYVPHSVYPDGYHCDPRQPLPFASLASQKNHMGLYLMCIYGRPEQQAWFEKAWKATGKRLDMGKACVRFKKLEDVPLEVVGEAIRRVPVKAFVEHYEAVFKRPSKRKVVKKKTVKKKAAAKKKATTKKTASKKTAPKKTAAKKAPAKKSTAKTAAKKKAPAKTAARRTAPSKPPRRKR